MVAPVREPRSRGVKCELCKTILASATWLDQTKLANSIEEAQHVVDMFRKHDDSDCPCIPVDVKLLILGITHFEIHRLASKKLDASVHSKQTAFINNIKKTSLSRKELQINDCKPDVEHSRFLNYTPTQSDENIDKELSKQSIDHLCRAIDLWDEAFLPENQPFNSKLALRLCLTHHTIHACYLFKSQRLLIYQLKTAILVVNVFKTIEGVKSNAILHANYLLVRSLIDCNQFSLARQVLKKATHKNKIYLDKTYYESILMTCVASELALCEKCEIYDVFEELKQISSFHKDDKLQHYYARTMALAIMIKYAHYHSKLSDCCNAFFQTFHYIGAIMRRCYESSFDLILALTTNASITKETVRSQDHENSLLTNHGWIRSAISDFVFSAFKQIVLFYIRCGFLESLELLYNFLLLIPHRSYNYYWITNLNILGSSLDILCDKFNYAEAKLDSARWAKERLKDETLFEYVDIQHDIALLNLSVRKYDGSDDYLVEKTFEKLYNFGNKFSDRVQTLEYYDSSENHRSKLSSVRKFNGSFQMNTCKALYIDLLKLSLSTSERSKHAYNESARLLYLAQMLKCLNLATIEYDELQKILESLLAAINIGSGTQCVIKALQANDDIIKYGGLITQIEDEFSKLKVTDKNKLKIESMKKQPKSRSKISAIAIGRSRHKSYQVSSKEQLSSSCYQNILNFDDCLKNLETLTVHEILLAYLRHSAPNPDFLLYRRVHEFLFSRRLQDRKADETLLFHLSESIATNSIRYRWMMLNESITSGQQNSSNKCCSLQFGKTMAFSGSSFEPDKTIRAYLKSIPADYRLVQFKYMVDKQSKTEHILAVSFELSDKPCYIHLHKSITENDDVFTATFNETDSEFPKRLQRKIDEAKKTLFFKNYKSRTEVRDRIEQELGLLLQELEDAYFGPFKVLLFARIIDLEYNKLVDQILEQVITFIGGETSCKSLKFARLFVEFAPYLSREEFCSGLRCVFNDLSGEMARDCFSIWLKSIESFMTEQNSKQDKRTYVNSLKKSQLGLILDKDLEFIPWENLPSVRLSKQGIFRVPSLRLFNAFATRSYSLPMRCDPRSTCYILDPANNLNRTRERFETKLKIETTWTGTVGCAPNSDQLRQWFVDKDIYIFIGHGSGTIYYNKLANQRGLTALAEINSLAIVMGCSSSRVSAEGPNLEPFGISWAFLLKGSPAYLGLLWDVTDTDIDRFLDSLLSEWLMSKLDEEGRGDRTNSNKSSTLERSSILTESVVKAKSVCQHKFLVGSTPVFYGLPVYTD